MFCENFYYSRKRFLHLHVVNSIPTKKTDVISTKIGLKNTIERLNLIYGKNYKLEYSGQKNTYIVDLKLQLKKFCRMREPKKCIIVDDEPAAHYVLANYIKQNPQLELVFQGYNGIEAMDYLRENPVDLMFLDINMPEISGMELLKLFQRIQKLFYDCLF
jgi:PleD family two-component response regulator